MAITIKTNVASLNAQRRLAKTTDDLQSSYNRLASGERINKSADDAAGLAVSENLRADIRSLRMSKRNTMDGISLVQTAEGGLEETANMLIRLRELAIQASSDTIGNPEREYLDREFLQLKEEINRIAATTEFNGTRLLVGRQQMPEDMNTLPNEFPLEVQVGKDYFPDSDAIDNPHPVNVIKIDFGVINGFTYGEGSLDLGEWEEGSRVNRKPEAQHAISKIDDAITRVNDHRAYLGSIQNRLISTSANLGNQIENLSESRSRIKDTDFAEETAQMAQLSILQQAGTSVLSNANASPNIALSLLK